MASTVHGPFIFVRRPKPVRAIRHDGSTASADRIRHIVNEAGTQRCDDHWEKVGTAPDSPRKTVVRIETKDVGKPRIEYAREGDYIVRVDDGPWTVWGRVLFEAEYQAPNG